MKQTVIYVHGKGGNAQESAFYAPFFPQSEVLGFDYRAQTPWEAAREFPAFFEVHRKGDRRPLLIANSIGAYFSMTSLDEGLVERALLISPIVDMARLIEDMMAWAGVSEEQLRAQGEIPTSFGETLSWRYLCCAREHPIAWRVPTSILCGERDNLTAQQTFAAFAARTHASLTVMPGGEHWFHTPEQLAFLGDWLRRSV